MINYSILALFKAVLPCGSSDNTFVSDEKTIPYGFVFSDEAKKQGISEDCFRAAKSIYGHDLRALNNSFYKSFGTVEKSSNEKIKFDQVLHYMTTYLAENVGVFDEQNVYVPRQILELPNGEPVKITIIGSISKEEVEHKIVKLITSGIALSPETVENIMTIVTELPIKGIDVAKVANREVKIALYGLYKIVPEDPVEFLRYLVYTVTGETLLIKDQKLIKKIKEANANEIEWLLSRYVSLNGLKPLATIFNRYKPLWLAAKSPLTSKTINKIRKLADIYHKPAKRLILDNITSADNVDFDVLKKELTKVTMFKKVRVANAIGYKLSNPTSVLYKIRNGKAYAEKASSGKPSNPEMLKKVYDIVLSDIVRQVKQNVGDKKVFIPENVNYAFPTSEKHFFGDVPYGSSVDIGDTGIVGVHWGDKDGSRIDLDLHLQNPTISFGWDSNFKGAEATYSGDMTSAPAPLGAAEAYLFKKDFKSNAVMVVLNHYNHYTSNAGVRYSLLVDKSEDDRMDSQYLVSQCTLLTKINGVICQPKQIVGLVVADTVGNKRFYFLNFDFGRGITTTINEKSNNAFQYLFDFSKTRISINQILSMAGVGSSNKEEADIDLSLEQIDKSTLIEILS